MTPKCRKCSSPIPQAVIAPAWADPSATMVMSGYRITEVSGSDTTSVLVAPADPKRMSIGFANGRQSQMWVAPHNNPHKSGWEVYESDGKNPGFFTLFTHGALVCAAWYMESGQSQSIFVYEIYRLQ